MHIRVDLCLCLCEEEAAHLEVFRPPAGQMHPATVAPSGGGVSLLQHKNHNGNITWISLKQQTFDHSSFLCFLRLQVKCRKKVSRVS